MKNITLTVDEKVLSAARRYATERNYSVNALVREYLIDIALREDRAAGARKRLKQLSRQSKARVGSK